MSTSAKLPVLITRSLLGLVFVVFGLNGFLHFMPMQPPEGAAGAFFGGLAAAGYFFPLLKATEVVGGALLLSGRLVPFGLTLLAPIIVNIAAFHFVLAPSGAVMGVVLVALEAYLAWTHRSAFAPLFRAPAATASERVRPQEAHAA
jgi:uncharacterized membrane protein YphA (DoxX/SURF4 family)